MGKHSRRKRQRGGKQPPQGTREEDSSSTLLQRLRHSDARTRHAALAALNATLLHPTNLSSSKQVSTQILQATRERVMDDDLECAQAAAGCLANYVSFASRRDKDELTAGWTLVFYERLKQCQQALIQQQYPSNTNSKQWLALTVQCQHALCALIETNPQALDRICGTDSLDLIRTMLGLFQYGQSQAETASITSEQEQEYVQEVTVYAARTLHSALDDNPELLHKWLGSTDELSIRGWNMLFEACNSASLPLVARLHAAGCVVTARQIVLLDGTSSSHADSFQNQILHTVLPLLNHSIELPSNFDSLLSDHVQANVLFEQQEADHAMERNVIQAVKEKGESGRSIARRQKLLKEEKKKQQQQQQQTSMEDETMEQNDNDANDNDESSPTQRTDAQEVLEQARKSWHAAVSPLQLALELVANVTSMNSMADDDDGGGIMAMQEDEIVWTAEQEAQLMGAARQTGEIGLPQGQNPLDVALAEALVQSGLGDRLISLLRSLCRPLLTDNNGKSVSSDVTDDIEDLQSKCAACLGNCIGNLSSWQVSPILWTELRSMATSAAGKGTEGVFDTMAVAMRTRPELRKQIQADDLEFLMNQLSSPSSTDSIKSDVVSILGVLCSTETHPPEVNAKVCSGLLSLLQSSSSSMVLSEVLNALMDMYGEDGRHAQVFDSLDVLGNFQRMLPRFKKRIQAERNKAPEESVEQWRETALNASRFISYKKGKL